MSWSYRQNGDLDDALVSGVRALEIAKKREDLLLQLYAASGLVEVHYYRGELSRAIELGREVLAALPPDWALRSFGGAVPVSIFTRLNLIYSLSRLGRFSVAAVYEVEMTQLAEQTHHAFTAGMAHNAATVLHMLKGDWANAHSRLERWLALARAADVRYQIGTAVAYSAWALAQLGERDEAMGQLREGKKLVEQRVARGDFGNSVHSYQALGRACLLLGHVEDAQRLARHASEAMAARPNMAPHILWLLGDIASHPDCFDPEQAETYYRNSMATAEAQGQRPFVAHCHLGLGRLSARIGKQQAATEHLSIAASMYREMDMRFWLGEAEAAMRESS